LICVDSAQCAYLNQRLAGHSRDLLSRLGSPPANSVTLYVVLCYRDCPTDNVPIPGEPCRSDSQLTAPSRLADDFELGLSFRRPEQREEDALKDFVRWLKQVTVSAAASTPYEQFLQAIRDAAGQWLAPDSPPSSPPSDFLFGSPPAFLNINPADLCRYTEAAFRLWVTELRPRWMGRRHGCAPASFGLSHEHDEECVLLAELDVPLLQNLPAAEWVAGSGVVLHEEGRPYIVHLRMLQEWLLCCALKGQAAGGAPPVINLAGEVTGPPNNNVLSSIGGVALEPGLPNFGQVLTVVNVAGQRRWRPTTPTVTSVVTEAGDVTGPSNNNTVGGIRRTPVVDIAPTANQVLTAFNDAGTIRWRPANLPAGAAVNLAGDATGPANNVTVERLRRVVVDATVPTANQVLMAIQEGGVMRWRPANLPAAPVAGPATLDGDVRGQSNNNTLEALRGTPLADDRPAVRQMLTVVADAETGRPSWRPTNDFVRFEADRTVPTYGVVAAGIIGPDFTTRLPSYRNPRLALQPSPTPLPGALLLTFTGYQQPTQPIRGTFSHHYIVKITPLTVREIPSPVITVTGFEANGITLSVTNLGQPVAPATLPRLGMSIEISRFPLAD